MVDVAALEVGAAELGLDLVPAQLDALARFAALLEKWSAVHNLTAIRDPRRVVSHHLLDCLAILPPLAAEATRDSAIRPLRILDVGSGGGLPAVPLAIAAPRDAMTAIDAVGKKVAFVQHVRAELPLPNLDAVHARVEDWSAPPFDVVVSRAFSSLPDFVRLTRHLLAPGGFWAAMKGVVPDVEVRDLPADVRLRRTVKLRVPLLDEQRHLLLLAPSAPPLR